MEFKEFLVNLATHIRADWAEVISFTMIGLIVIVCLTGAGCFYLFLMGHIIASSIKKIKTKKGKIYDIVMMHSYKPCRSAEGETIVPKRGIPIASIVVDLSIFFHCPILVVAGKTMAWDSRKESDIYKKYINNIYVSGDIITAQDGSIRDTEGEVYEAERICKQRGFTNILVVGSWPHLVRIHNYWKSVIDKGEIKITFVGVHISSKFYVWELAMWLFDGIIFGKILPRRWRESALDIMGRRGPSG